jgi:hypothetical protein
MLREPPFANSSCRSYSYFLVSGCSNPKTLRARELSRVLAAMLNHKILRQAELERLVETSEVHLMKFRSK